MKTMFKRAVSVLIVIVMLVPLISAMGLTVSAESYSGTCGDNLTWSLNTSTGVLNIRGTGTMTWYGYSSFSSSAPWSSYISYIKSVVIGDSVTSIGSYAFSECTSLTSVTIGNSVTSIGNYAFCNCDSLTSVFIPYSVTSIGSCAFYSCSSLTRVTIPYSVTSIGSSAFENCYSLTSATIPYSVTSIGGDAFYNCIALTSVTIPDSVTSIGSDAFYNTAYYNNSSNWVNKVLYIGKHLIEAFPISGSYSIKDGTLTIADRAFYNSTPLTSVTIPDSVTCIGSEAFYNCKSLTSVTIGNSVTSIGWGAFRGCTSLTSVTIPDSVTSIGGSAFDSCTSLTSVTIPASVTSIGSDAFHYNNNGYSKPLNLTIICYENSYAHTYAENKGFEYELKHIFTNYISDDNYTCTEDGTKTAYCDNGCGASDTVLDVGSKRHRYTQDILEAPTCYSEGFCLYICKCGDSYTDVMPVAEHSYTNYISNNDSTCVKDGTKYAYCDYGCGNIKSITDEGTAFGHSFTNYISNDDATCTQDGTKTAYCDNGCGESDTVTDEGTMLGHSFTLYTTNDDYTCTKDGTETAKCDRCDGTDTRTLIGTAAHRYVKSILRESTCSVKGYAMFKCSCGDYYTQNIELKAHTFGEWTVTVEPTSTTTGSQTRSCAVCGATETEEIPMTNIPEITIDNYRITITKANDIKDMRFAIGEYTTPTQIKNAEGNVALSNAIVVKNTVDGLFEYTMPDGGYYTFWIRMNDGNEYFLYADMTKMNQEVVADGVTITIKNLYGVKDFFIAEGDYDTYAEVKANYIFNATHVKIGTKHDYTYIVNNPGVHTVLIRYKDSTRANEFIKINLTVDEPVFTTNGLQVTIGNIPDVKVIRTAYGEYNTPGDVKRAAGSRNFSNKSVIKNADDYTIQYREEGIVTIIVEYNNGYVKVFHHNIQKKEASVEQNGNIITFGNLEDLNILRYSKGTYTTSDEIKYSSGNKYFKSADIVDGTLVVALDKGTYTFYIQFDDESYDFYTIIVE